MYIELFVSKSGHFLVKKMVSLKITKLGKKTNIEKKDSYIWSRSSIWQLDVEILNIMHCYHVNDFPLINSTPGIIQDLIDLLLA